MIFLYAFGMVHPQGIVQGSNTTSAHPKIFLPSLALTDWQRGQIQFLEAAGNEGLIRPWQSQMMSKAKKSLSRQIRAIFYGKPLAADRRDRLELYTRHRSLAEISHAIHQ